MALHTLPEVYAHLEGSDNIRWVHAEKVWLWEEKGWAVNKAKGREYGEYDSVLMIKEGCDIEDVVEDVVEEAVTDEPKAEKEGKK